MNQWLHIPILRSTTSLSRLFLGLAPRSRRDFLNLLGQSDPFPYHGNVRQCIRIHRRRSMRYCVSGWSQRRMLIGRQTLIIRLTLDVRLDVSRCHSRESWSVFNGSELAWVGRKESGVILNLTRDFFSSSISAWMDQCRVQFLVEFLYEIWVTPKLFPNVWPSMLFTNNTNSF